MIHDLLERVLTVGDKHDKRMAELAGEEVDKLEADSAALTERVRAQARKVKDERFLVEQNI